MSIAEVLGCICPNCQAELPIIGTFATRRISFDNGLRDHVICPACKKHVRIAGNSFAVGGKSFVFALPFFLVAFALGLFWPTEGAVGFLLTMLLVLAAGVRLNGLEVAE